MKDRLANRRIRLLLVLLLVAFAATLARAVWLQGVDAATLGVDLAPRTRVLAVTEPKARAGGIKVADVATLLDKLKTQAKVI